MARHPSPDRVLQARSKLANATRAGEPKAVLTAKLDLKSAILERAIPKAVEEAPPLTHEQRDQLAALLSSGGVR